MSNTKLPKSLTGFSCPNCGRYCSTGYQKSIDNSFISKTQPVFVLEPDPHYTWTETHRCLSCDTIYTLDNST